MPRLPRLSWAYSNLAALLAGLGLGFVSYQWPTVAGTLLISWLDPLGSLWLAALQLLVIPLVVSLLIPAIGRHGGMVPVRMGVMTVFWFCALLAGASLITLVAGTALLDALPVNTGTMAAFQEMLPAEIPSAAIAEAAPGIRDWLANLIPTNLFQSLAAGDLVSIIVVAIIFGIALRYVTAGLRASVLGGLDGLAEWCMALAGLLLRVMPIAVFILSLRAAGSSGGEIASGLAYYIFWVSAMLLAVILLLYPLTRFFGSLPLQQFARGIWPAQVQAFSCRSSIACLPIMLTTARQRLKLPKSVVDFVVPFAASTFKLNMGVSAIFQMLFLLHVFDVQVEPAALLLAAAALAAQSIATPGLPSGAIWTTTPVYLALGIPLEGIVLTNVVDTIPDLFKTTLNVSGNLSITAIVSGRSGP